jgi:transposase-like protein
MKAITPNAYNHRQELINKQTPEYNLNSEIEEINLVDHPIFEEIHTPSQMESDENSEDYIWEDRRTQQQRDDDAIRMQIEKDQRQKKLQGVANKMVETINSVRAGEEEMIKNGVCPNCNSYYLQNSETGEVFRLGCKRYDCPVCGKYRAVQLRKSLESYLKKWRMIRMMTLTYRTTIFRDELQCANLSSKIFARFTTNYRRHPRATEFERACQYVKTVEFTQSGYIHYHVLIDRFVRWEIMVESWIRAINTVMGIEGTYHAMSKNTNHTEEEREANRKLYTGSVNFKLKKHNPIIRIDGTVAPNKAAQYITKYVTKACGEFRKKFAELYEFQARKFKVWTKSAKIGIFTHKVKDGKWQFINLSEFDRTHVLNLVTLELSSQEYSKKLAVKNQFI